MRDLDTDLARLRDVLAADVLVNLLEPDEQAALGIATLGEQAERAGLVTLRLPITDGSVPPRPALDAMVERILSVTATGKNVVVHCRGGLGRTGLVVGACLRARGLDGPAALELVRRVRPGAVETEPQEALLLGLPTGPRPALAVDFARFRGCLLGGAIGDALGYPIEFDNHHSIVTRWGETPPEPLAYADTVPAIVSDDTQMTLFTAEALLTARAPGDRLEHLRQAYLRWLSTQVANEAPGPPGGWLVGVERLHVRRAPGNTCLSALLAQCSSELRPSVSTPINDSKGCGAVMRSAPIGLAARSRDDAFELARDAGALTHGHPSGYLSAAYFAALIHDLSRGGGLDAALEAADALLACEFGAEETQRFVAEARMLAAKGPPTADAIQKLGGGWTGESALAIALACVLTADGFATTLWRAVAHDGDSDSTGSLVGNLLGALHGDAALPPRWVLEVELRDVTDALASDLYDAAVLGARLDRDLYG
jgi:ADP-ribosylglycohydrolase